MGDGNGVQDGELAEVCKAKQRSSIRPMTSLCQPGRHHPPQLLLARKRCMGKKIASTKMLVSFFRHQFYSKSSSAEFVTRR